MGIKYTNNTTIQIPLDNKLYNLLGGPYNRRNIYGAVFSHGPFFDSELLIKIRQEVLYYAVCDSGTVAREFELDGNINHVTINVISRITNTTIGNLNIKC